MPPALKSLPCFAICLWLGLPHLAHAAETLRIATYNVAMYRNQAGELAAEIAGGKSDQAAKIAEVLQRVRPDVVLLNEFDYMPPDVMPPDVEGRCSLVDDFRKLYLERSQSEGLAPLSYPYTFYQPSNTGVDSGMDLDRDGQLGGPADAHGFGRYAGQYGMLVLSRLPIDEEASQTFQRFRWAALPNALFPVDPSTGASYYPAEDRKRMRLVSKSFWSVALSTPGFAKRDRLWLLCSHPTPPVFDGPEDRNGCRNHDEIALLTHYLSGNAEGWLTSDQRKQVAGLAADEEAVVLGDLNADPADGSGHARAIRQLLEHPRIQAKPVPRGAGGKANALLHADLNRQHRGDASHDTADFSGDGQGNYRVDYALPTDGLRLVDCGVYWPKPTEPGSAAVQASDHRLVWIDLAPTGK